MPNTLSAIFGLTEFKGGQLWIEGRSPGVATKPKKLGTNGEPVDGHMVKISGSGAVFDATKWHGTESFTGTRWILTAYQPRIQKPYDLETLNKLESLGFRVDGLKAQAKKNVKCAVSNVAEAKQSVSSQSSISTPSTETDAKRDELPLFLKQWLSRLRGRSWLVGMVH